VCVLCVCTVRASASKNACVRGIWVRARLRYVGCRVGLGRAARAGWRALECADTLRRLFSRTELKVDASDRNDVRGVGLGGGGYAWSLFLA